METLKERLEEIFFDVLGRDDLVLTEDLSLKEIEDWDSLVHVTLMEAIQDEFGISFSLEEILKLETVGEILSAIQEKIGK